VRLFRGKCAAKPRDEDMERRGVVRHIGEHRRSFVARKPNVIGNISTSGRCHKRNRKAVEVDYG
jgi:hypothetical protein